MFFFIFFYDWVHHCGPLKVHLCRHHSIYKSSYVYMSFCKYHLLVTPLKYTDSWGKNTIHCSFYSSRRHLSLYIFTVPVLLPPSPLSGKTEFMSPCISLRQTDGYTQRLRRTYTARHSDCSFYAILFMLYSLMLDSEAFFFSCAHYCSVSLLSPFYHDIFTYFSIFLFCRTFLFICSHFPPILSSNPLQCFTTTTPFVSLIVTLLSSFSVLP